MLKQTLLGDSLPANRLLLLGLALGWSADLLFYGKAVGISLLLFVLLFLAAFGYASRLAGVAPRWRHLWLLLPLLFFAGMASIRANPYLTAFNVLATLVCLTYLLFFYAAGHPGSLTTVGALLLPARVGGNSLLQATPLVRRSAAASDIPGQTRRHLAPIVRGLLLSLPVLAVFTLLLSSADAVFAQYVTAVLNLQIVPEVIELGWRLLLIGAMAWLLAGGMVWAWGRAAAEEDQGMVEKTLERIPRMVVWGFTETAILLGLVNLLFSLFVAVQFTYLFGGIRNVSITGYSYAEYARRGFFELVAVAALSLTLVLGLNWLTRRESKRQLKLFNALSTLMTAMVLVMLVSAWRRMNLYEAAYGYTQLRLMVYLFMGWLGALLVWFLWTLWRRPEWFALGLLAAAVGFLGTLNVINPDAFIVRQNVARYLETGDLDVVYLNTLSDDAVPALLPALAAVQGDEELLPNPACGRAVEMPDGGAVKCEMTRAELLTEGLADRLAALSEDTGWRRWQSLNLSRYRAFYLLQGDAWSGVIFHAETRRARRKT